jgi:inorganic pyrophosphatase
LDIVVAAYDPAFPGCVVRTRPIGALDITNSKGEEHNVLAVPDDPRFAEISALEDLPDQNLREIEQFFEVYKWLEGDEEVAMLGRLGLDATHELIREYAQAYARA